MTAVNGGLSCVDCYVPRRVMRSERTRYLFRDEMVSTASLGVLLAYILYFYVAFGKYLVS